MNFMKKKIENAKDLEYCILSCILINPELMEKVTLEDKYFTRSNRMWQFMKAFYQKFKNFDINLMYSVCKDKYQIITMVEILLDYDAIPSNFEKYQKQLAELYDEENYEKMMINKIFEKANELYVRNININDFKKYIDELYNKEKLKDEFK